MDSQDVTVLQDLQDVMVVTVLLDSRDVMVVMVSLEQAALQLGLGLRVHQD